MKKLLALSLALVMVLMAFAGCGAKTPPAPGSNPGTSEPGPAPAGPKEIIVNLGSEPPMMNSILTTSTGSMNVLRHIVDGLVALDQNDEPIPGVAESWTYDEATMTYTFKLRKDYKWNNGEPVTAHDFIFAWDTFFSFEAAAPYAGTWAPLILGATERMNVLTDEQYNALDAADKAAIDAAKPSAEFLADMAAKGYENGIGYKAVDDYTLQVTVTGPYPYFLSIMAFPNFFPINEKGYNEMGGVDAYGTEAELLLTNGAFNMTAWNHEDSIVLEKSANYPKAGEINLDKITMLMISDTGTAFNTFLAGEVDMIGLNGEQAQNMRDQGRNVLFYDDGSCWYFEFQNEHKGLNNKKVRQALTMAIDAELFIETVTKNNSAAAYSFVPPAISNGTFTAKVGKLVNRDAAAAKKLLDEGLAELGMTAADLKLTIIADEGDTAAKNCAFFQEQWKTALGIDVAVEQMTYKNRIERMQNHDFDIVMAGWGPDYNDPMTFLDLFVTGNGNNHTKYSNKAYDKLVADAMVEPDAAKREGIMIEIEKVLMDDMPVGPIYNRARDYICSDRLTGVVRTAFTDMSFIYADVVA